MFAVIKAMHLLMLAVFVGAALIVDLRLLGVGLRERPVQQVARDAHPWLLGVSENTLHHPPPPDRPRQ